MKHNIYISYLLSITLILLIYNTLLRNINILFIPSLIISYILGYLLIKILSKFKINNILIKLLSSILIIIIIYKYSKDINVYYLKETNILFIYLSLIIVSIYISSKDINTLNNLSSFIFYLSVISIILIILFNLKNFNINNLVNQTYINNLYDIPILTISSSILDIIYINNYKVKIDEVLKGYLYSFISILFLSISIISTLGITLISNSNYPFYLSLKKIQLLNFIERIENLLISFTIFDVIFTLVFLIITIKQKKIDK